MPYKDPIIRKQKAKEQAAKRKAKNPELFNKIAAARTALWKQRHPERVKESQKRTREKGKDRALITTKAWRAANMDKVREHWRRSQEKKNSDPIKLAHRREQQREYYNKNKEWRIPDASYFASMRRVRLKGCQGTCSKEQWKARLEYFGFRCVYCNCELTAKTASKDHFKPVTKKGSNWPANLYPACLPCNKSKGSRTIYPLHLRKYLTSS